MGDDDRSKKYKDRFYIGVDKKSDKINQIKNKSLRIQTGAQAEWSKIISDMRIEYKELKALWSIYLNKDIPLNYRISIKHNIDRLEASKDNRDLLRNKLTKIDELLNSNVHRGTIKALIQEATLTAITGINEGEKKNISDMRKIQQNLLTQKVMIAEGLAEGGSIPSVSKKILENLQDQLLEDGIIRVNGRDYDAKKYARMVAITETRKAQTQSTVNLATQYGSDLVQVSDHNTICPICAPYEGKIFSLTGKDEDFPIFDGGIPGHPNCQHSITVVFREWLELRGIQKYIDFANGETQEHPTREGHIDIHERENLDQDKLEQSIERFNERQARLR